MRFTIIFLLAVAGCSSKYDECLDNERENYRSSHPNASHSEMSRKQQEFEMMCSQYKGK